MSTAASSLSGPIVPFELFATRSTLSDEWNPWVIGLGQRMAVMILIRQFGKKERALSIFSLAYFRGLDAMEKRNRDGVERIRWAFQRGEQRYIAQSAIVRVRSRKLKRQGLSVDALCTEDTGQTKKPNVFKKQESKMERIPLPMWGAGLIGACTMHPSDTHINMHRCQAGRQTAG